MRRAGLEFTVCFANRPDRTRVSGGKRTRSSWQARKCHHGVLSLIYLLFALLRELVLCVSILLSHKCSWFKQNMKTYHRLIATFQDHNFESKTGFFRLLACRPTCGKEEGEATISLKSFALEMLGRSSEIVVLIEKVP
jgi:hypothetical protein